MAAIAAFATSDKGQFYARVCERYGIDPAAEIEDEIVALNLRAALLLGVPDEPTAEMSRSEDGHVVVRGLDPFG